MMIHTGLRTDIPAYYSRWFFNRLKAGYVLVRNPYHLSQVTRYKLSPNVVDLIGFYCQSLILDWSDKVQPGWAALEMDYENT